MVNGLSRARLGGRRHRGRGGDARPADLDADPGGRRLPPRRQIARGRDRDRPRADRDADAAAARRRRPLCRILRPRRRRAGARRPRDDRQHGAGIRRDLRLLPDRRRDDPLSDHHRARPGAGQAGRGLCQGAGAVARRRTRRTRPSPTCSNSISARSSRRSPGRAGRRTGWRCPASRRRSTANCRGSPAGSRSRARSTGRGHELRTARRRRRDRRDHQLHQHLEPERHARPPGCSRKRRSRRASRSSRGSRPASRRAARWSATITRRPGCRQYLDQVGFNLVGYGCTTCIGNSGPLPDPVSEAIDEGDLAVCAVLSGNRNFEGRIHAQVRANYLASPPLVVAYALAGSIRHNLTTEPLGEGNDGKPVYLRDIWPSNQEVNDTVARSVQARQLPAPLRQRVRGAAGMARRAEQRRHDLPVRGQLDLSRAAALFREHAEGAGADART